ncbi:type II secretion system F family protein [Ornithinimicrobium sp. Y1694]|uniref:type II secretion system F family protein n=1 Tax=Ornithinimicrobium sp. Y1694 TaxID=3418590 RepID=UPI003CE83465
MLGPILLGLATCVVLALILVPSRELSRDRRRYGVEEDASLVTRAAGAATSRIGRALDRSGRRRRWGAALDLAGIRMEVADFVLVVGAALLAAFSIGLVIQGLILALLLVFMTLAAVLVWVNLRASQRRSAFADQIDDLVTLLASNMRAGHSLVSGLDFVSRELEDPASSELARVVNQSRVGRDLNDALADAAERMDSDDFRWVGQAIAIHRQVGGNLAEVLDTVGETVRERGQIRRQVKSLAAEGKLSALVLMALPFVVSLILAFLNPSYIGVLFSSAFGYFLLFVGIVLLTIGGLWLRKLVEVKF